MKTMIARIFAACLVGGLATGAAFAADIPERGPAPAPAPAPAPIFTWTGFYVGVSGGFAGDKFVYPVSVTGALAANGSASVTSSGFLVGPTVGYNYQFANGMVVGLEADWSWSTVKGQVNLAAAVPGFGVALSATAGSKLRHLGTVRGRLGYAWDRALLYVTGGWAWGSVRSSLTASLAPLGAVTLSRNNSVNGWVIGGGLEYGLTRNLSFKTEYLYVRLGKGNLVNVNLFGGPPAGVNINLDVKPTVHVVRAGLNYRFNWGAPASVVARY